MTTARPLVLTGSAVGNPPVGELVGAARAAGFHGLSLWPASGYGSSADHRRVIQDAGLFVHDVDAIVAWVGPDDPGPPYYEESPPPVVWAAADALGATNVNVLLVGSRRATPEDAAEVLATVSDEAASRGLGITLEFARGTAAPDLQTAARIVELAARPNASLLIDAWHWHWSGASAADVRALRPGSVGGVQLSDAPAERPVHLLHATRYHREVPGAGVADLAGLVDAIDSLGTENLPLVVEVFNQPLLERHGVAGFAALLAEATRAIAAR
jgi:sugar phosphate isomerase/epimerase